MAYKAHVWLTRRPGERRIDLGTIEVDPKPEWEAQVSFEYEGKPTQGLIDQIDPHDWETRPGIVPRIHVCLSEDKPSPGERPAKARLSLRQTSRRKL